MKYGLSKPPEKRWPIFTAVFFCILLITLILRFLTGGLFHILDYADFYFIRKSYLQKVALVPQTDVPRFIVFDWKIGRDQRLYFDETDELGKPCETKKTKDWWLKVRKEDATLMTTDWGSRKVSEHFYVVQFNVYSSYSCSPIPSLDE